MTRSQAEKIVLTDITSLSIEELQKHKVKTIDAWRSTKADYGLPQALKDGFLIEIQGERSISYAPKNKWLLQNLGAHLEQIYDREAYLLSIK